LLWLLRDERVASTLPNVYNEKQLAEFATISDCPPLTDDEMARVAKLYAENFGLEDEAPAKFKGTMELAESPRG
jgi:aryl-alcohol dehydrogenase-like predicted oxidoreductase